MESLGLDEVPLLTVTADILDFEVVLRGLARHESIYYNLKERLSPDEIYSLFTEKFASFIQECEMLDLSEMNLKRFPFHAVSKMRNLKKLFLTGNSELKLTDKDIGLIKHRVETLYMRRMDTAISPNQWAKIISSPIRQNKVTLDISCKHALSQFLKEFENLEIMSTSMGVKWRISSPEPEGLPNFGFDSVKILRLKTGKGLDISSKEGLLSFAQSTDFDDDSFQITYKTLEVEMLVNEDLASILGEVNFDLYNLEIKIVPKAVTLTYQSDGELQRLFSAMNSKLYDGLEIGVQTPTETEFDLFATTQNVKRSRIEHSARFTDNPIKFLKDTKFETGDLLKLSYVPKPNAEFNIPNRDILLSTLQDMAEFSNGKLKLTFRPKREKSEILSKTNLLGCLAADKIINDSLEIAFRPNKFETDILLNSELQIMLSAVDFNCSNVEVVCKSMGVAVKIRSMHDLTTFFVVGFDAWRITAKGEVIRISSMSDIISLFQNYGPFEVEPKPKSVNLKVRSNRKLQDYLRNVDFCVCEFVITIAPMPSVTNLNDLDSFTRLNTTNFNIYRLMITNKSTNKTGVITSRNELYDYNCENPGSLFDIKYESINCKISCKEDLVRYLEKVSLREDSVVIDFTHRAGNVTNTLYVKDKAKLLSLFKRGVFGAESLEISIGQKLDDLDISDNTNLSGFMDAEEFKYGSDVQELQMKCCKLSFRELKDATSKFRILDVLDASGNNGIELIEHANVTFAPSNCRLRKLSMCGCDLSSAMVEALCVCKKIQVLNIRANDKLDGEALTKIDFKNLRYSLLELLVAPRTLNWGQKSKIREKFVTKVWIRD